MNIFEIYLNKIKKIIIKLNNENLIKIPNTLDSINVDVPPAKFNCDISTNVAMMLSKINNTLSSPIVLLFTISIITTLIFGIKFGYKNIKLENISIAMIPVFFVYFFSQRAFFNEYIIYVEILLLFSIIIMNIDYKYSSLTKYVLLIIIPVQLYYNYQWVVLPRGQTVSRFCEMLNYAPQFIEIVTNDHTVTNSYKAGVDRIAPLGKNYEKIHWRDTCVSVLTRDYEIYYHNVDNSYGK